MPEIEILLDGFKTTYLPGEIVSGYVNLNISQHSHPLTEVSIKLIAESSVAFNEGNRQLSDTEYHVEAEKMLWKPNFGQRPPVFEQNRRFRFSFELPETCVPTIKHNHFNSTVYKLVAKKHVQKPKTGIISSLISSATSHASNSNMATVFLEIIPLPININLFPYLMIEKSQFKECENTRVTATIPHSIFSCGKIIYVTLKITRDQLREYVTLSTTLTKIISFRAKSMGAGNHKTYLAKSEVIREQRVSDNVTLYENSTKFFKHAINIPTDLIPSFGEDSIIQIKYIINTKIHFKDTSGKIIKFTFPIVLSKDAIPSVNPSNTSSATTIAKAALVQQASINLETVGPPSYSQALYMPPSNQVIPPPPSYSETISE